MGSSVRFETITGIARQLSVVLSRRVSQTVGLWGEPGIGKTHTLRRILCEIPCQSLSVHATVPEAALVRALPHPKKIPAWAEMQLERLLSGEQIEARVLVDTLAAILCGLAPFVLHVEDLHEASPQRLELIVALARAVTRTRGVGLMVTSRAELPAPFLNHRLEPLDAQETTAILKQEMGADLPSDGLEWIQARTRGNPLFALEFARYLTRQGFLWSDGQRWNWRAPPEGFVPVTIEAMISQLVSGQSVTPEAQAVLEARAILPTEGADLGVWLAVAGVSPEHFDRAHAGLEHAGLLSAAGFMHPLISEVVAHELPAARRREYARRAIGALEETAPELAATFIGDAGLSDLEALALLERAISRARKDGDQVRVVRLQSLAVEYASGIDRARLALEAEKALQMTGDYRARERLARCAFEAQPENPEARYALGNVLAIMGQHKEVETLLAGLSQAECAELRWVEMLFRAQAHAQLAEDALRTWSAHPELAQQPGGSSLHTAIQSYCDISDMNSAEALIVQSLARADLSLQNRGLIVNDLAFIRCAQGRYEEAQQLYDQSTTLQRQDAQTMILASGLYGRAINLERLGRLEEARSDLLESIGLYDRSGNMREAANIRTFCGYLLMRMGDFLRAESTLLEAHEISARFGVTINHIICERELGRLYAEWQPLHGAALALKFMRDAISHMRDSKYPQLASHVLSAAAYVAARQGDGPSAMAFATEALEALGDQDCAEEHYDCVVALARALEANADPVRALECWREAHAHAQHLGLQVELCETELEIVRLQPDPRRGLELLEWFEQRGLGSLVRRARRYFPDAEPAPVLTPILGARLEVLGAMRLSQGGQPVIYRGRKRTEILAFLLEARIAGRLEVAAPELVDALYPDELEAEARNTLKQQVYLIRSSLGADSVISTPNGYALGAVSSDAEDFLRTGEADLWRGAYLSGFGEGWRSGVRDALTLALRSRIEVLLEIDPSEAARLGRILCEMEPYDPGALHLAVRALEVSGDERAARKLYLDGRTRLLEVGESLPARLDDFLAVVPA